MSAADRSSVHVKGLRVALLVLIGVVGLAACAGAEAGSESSAGSVTTATSALPPDTTVTTMPPAPTTSVAESTTTTVDPYARPDWLGTRPLPLRDDGLGEIQPTPAELAPRILETIDILAPPTGEEFESSIGSIPHDVLARSTWSEGCPVTVDELSYVTVSHWGFDQRFHTGELIVNAAYADDIVEVFRQLHDARFPIEQMQVASVADLDAAPTGDGNVTGSFVCRPTVGSTSWSRHAFGTAIDVDPFQNPYLKDDIVIPELASYYADRSLDQPGMIHADDVVVQAFASIGWQWGGDYETLKDYMHFSADGG